MIECAETDTKPWGLDSLLDQDGVPATDAATADTGTDGASGWAESATIGNADVGWNGAAAEAAPAAPPTADLSQGESGSDAEVGKDQGLLTLDSIPNILCG